MASPRYGCWRFPAIACTLASWTFWTAHPSWTSNLMCRSTTAIRPSVRLARWRRRQGRSHRRRRPIRNGVGGMRVPRLTDNPQNKGQCRLQSGARRPSRDRGGAGASGAACCSRLRMTRHRCRKPPRLSRRLFLPKRRKDRRQRRPPAAAAIMRRKPRPRSRPKGPAPASAGTCCGSGERIPPALGLWSVPDGASGRHGPWPSAGAFRALCPWNPHPPEAGPVA